eukprot:2461955-Pleurochrysis_carterae.AAC.1
MDCAAAMVRVNAMEKAGPSRTQLTSTSLMEGMLPASASREDLGPRGVRRLVPARAQRRRVSRHPQA